MACPTFLLGDGQPRPASTPYTSAGSKRRTCAGELIGRRRMLQKALKKNGPGAALLRLWRGETPHRAALPRANLTARGDHTTSAMLPKVAWELDIKSFEAFVDARLPAKFDLRSLTKEQFVLLAQRLRRGGKRSSNTW
jgi:hypothetical protein